MKRYIKIRNLWQRFCDDGGNEITHMLDVLSFEYIRYRDTGQIDISIYILNFEIEIKIGEPRCS